MSTTTPIWGGFFIFIRYSQIANGDRGRSAQSGVHDRASPAPPATDPANL